MTTRALFGTLFVILAIALGVCALFARFSRKAHNQSAALLLVSLIPPVVGNMIITFTADQALATAGCMIYYIGMTLLMQALLHFTFDYCRLKWPNKVLPLLVSGLLLLDVVQLAVNPFFTMLSQPPKSRWTATPTGRWSPAAGSGSTALWTTAFS